MLLIKLRHKNNCHENFLEDQFLIFFVSVYANEKGGYKREIEIIAMGHIKKAKFSRKREGRKNMRRIYLPRKCVYNVHLKGKEISANWRV